MIKKEATPAKTASSTTTTTAAAGATAGVGASATPVISGTTGKKEAGQTTSEGGESN